MFGKWLLGTVLPEMSASSGILVDMTLAFESQDYSVGMASAKGWTTDGSKFDSGKVKIVISPCCVHLLWGPPSLLFIVYRSWSSRGVKLAPRLRKRGSIPHSPSHATLHMTHIIFNLACGSVRVWNLASDIKAGTYTNRNESLRK
jgi:hypothetical protein